MRRTHSLPAILLVALLPAAPLAASAQEDQAGYTAPDLTGTWETDTPEGPQRVVVRPDSSASFGEETIRWRLAADTVYLAFGDEWVGYHFVLRGRSLTLSGGDLLDPVRLTRVGPPSPLPEGVTVPPAPRRPDVDP